MNRLAAALTLALLAWPGVAVAGPELVDGVVTVPAGPGCPPADPRVAVFDDREVWLWRSTPRIEGALFRDGGTTPDPRGFLTSGERSSTGLRLAQGYGMAWAGWATPGIGLELQQIPGSGEEPLGPLVSVSAFSSFDLAVTPDRGALVVQYVPQGPFTRGGGFFESIVVAPDGMVGERTILDRRELTGGPRLHPMGDGTFALAWTEVDGGRQAVVARRLDATGGAVGEPLIVFRGEEGRTVVTPVGVARWFGGLVLAWGERDPLGQQQLAWLFVDFELKAVGPVRRTAGGAFPVSGLSRVSAVDLAAGPDGRLLLVWESGGRIVGQYLGTPGDLLDSPFLISPPSVGESRNPDLAFGPDGRLTVVWEQRPLNPPFDAECLASAYAIQGRRSLGPACPADALCLQADRFAVSVAWNDPASGTNGHGVPVPINEDSGSFWFFDRENLELMVKVIDGRAINGHFWVFFGSLTNVGFELTVRDRVTGVEKTYVNPPFTFASRGETTAFTAPSP